MAHFHGRTSHPGAPVTALAPAGAVLAGGAIGAAARSGLSLALPVGPGSFPVTTLLVNVVGSFLLGLYLSRRQRSVLGQWSFQFVAIGILGSLTTFSAFSLEVFQLIDVGANVAVFVYIVASLFGGLGAALLGDRLGRVGRWR